MSMAAVSDGIFVTSGCDQNKFGAFLHVFPRGSD